MKNSKKNIYAPLLAIVFVTIFIQSCSTDGSRIKPSYLEVFKQVSPDYNYIDTNELKIMAKRYVFSGANFQQQFRFADAILEFQDALKFDTSAGIYYAIGKCYKELYKFDNALDNLYLSLEYDSTFVPSLELLADIFIMKFQIDKALEIYLKINEIQPNQQNKLSLARLYELKQPEKAIQIYKELLNENEDRNILARLADVYSDIKDTTSLLDALEKLYRYDSQNSGVAGSLLETYIGCKMFQKAESMLENVDKTFSSEDLLPIYIRTSDLLNDLPSDTAKTLKELFVSRIDNRFYFDWYLNIIAGIISDRIGNFPIAERFFNHTLIIADSLEFIPIEVAWFYSRNKKNDKAIEILLKYQDSSPEYGQYPFNLGIFYQFNNDYEAALAATKRAIQIDSNKIDYWTQLGLIYNHMDIMDSSDYCYEKALSIDSLDPLTNNNYAYSLSERKIHLDRALLMINIALEAEPKNNSYIDTYGWIQFQLGNYDVALEYIQKSIQLGAETAEAYEHLGDIYHKKGNLEEAKNAWNKGLLIEPDNESLIKRIKLLE